MKFGDDRRHTTTLPRPSTHLQMFCQVGSCDAGRPDAGCTLEIIISAIVSMGEIGKIREGERRFLGIRKTRWLSAAAAPGYIGECRYANYRGRVVRVSGSGRPGCLQRVRKRLVCGGRIKRYRYGVKCEYVWDVFPKACSGGEALEQQPGIGRMGWAVPSG